MKPSSHVEKRQIAATRSGEPAAQSIVPQDVRAESATVVRMNRGALVGLDYHVSYRSIHAGSPIPGSAEWVADATKRRDEIRMIEKLLG